MIVNTKQLSDSLECVMSLSGPLGSVSIRSSAYTDNLLHLWANYESAVLSLEIKAGGVPHNTACCVQTAVLINALAVAADKTNLLISDNTSITMISGDNTVVIPSAGVSFSGHPDIAKTHAAQLDCSLLDEADNTGTGPLNSIGHLVPDYVARFIGKHVARDSMPLIHDTYSALLTGPSFSLSFELSNHMEGQ